MLRPSVSVSPYLPPFLIHNLLTLRPSYSVSPFLPPYFTLFPSRSHSLTQTICSLSTLPSLYLPISSLFHSLSLFCPPSLSPFLFLSVSFPLGLSLPLLISAHAHSCRLCFSLSPSVFHSLSLFSPPYISPCLSLSSTYPLGLYLLFLPSIPISLYHLLSRPLSNSCYLLTLKHYLSVSPYLPPSLTLCLPLPHPPSLPGSLSPTVTIYLCLPLPPSFSVSLSHTYYLLMLKPSISVSPYLPPSFTLRLSLAHPFSPCLSLSSTFPLGLFLLLLLSISISIYQLPSWSPSPTLTICSLSNITSLRLHISHPLSISDSLYTTLPLSLPLFPQLCL